MVLRCMGIIMYLITWRTQNFPEIMMVFASTGAGLFFYGAVLFQRKKKVWIERLGGALIS